MKDASRTERHADPSTRQTAPGRRVIVVGASIASLLFVTVGAGVGLWCAREAIEQSQQRAKTAEQQCELAIDTLNDVLGEVQSALETVPESYESRRRILQVAVNGLDDLDSSPQALGGRLTQSLVMARQDLGDILMRYGAENGEDGQLAALRHFRRAEELCRTWVEADPNDATPLQQLEVSQSRIGSVLLRLDEIDNARDTYLKALATNALLRHRFPTSKAHLRGSYAINNELGVCDLRQFKIKSAGGRFLTAKESLEKAIAAGGQTLKEHDAFMLPELKEQVAVVAALPKLRRDENYINELSPTIQPRILFDLAQWYAHDGDFLQSAATLDRMQNMDGLTVMHFYNNACGYARCIKGLRNDTQAASTELEARLQEFRGKAVACLRQAKEGGMFNDDQFASFVLSDPDLEPLRNDSRFNQLADSLRAQLRRQ